MTDSTTLDLGPAFFDQTVARLNATMIPAWSWREPKHSRAFARHAELVLAEAGHDPIVISVGPSQDASARSAARVSAVVDLHVPSLHDPNRAEYLGSWFDYETRQHTPSRHATTAIARGPAPLAAAIVKLIAVWRPLITKAMDGLRQTHAYRTGGRTKAETIAAMPWGYRVSRNLNHDTAATEVCLSAPYMPTLRVADTWVEFERLSVPYDQAVAILDVLGPMVAAAREKADA